MHADRSSSERAAESIELVRRAQGGDREALDRLVARYYPRVRRIVRLRMGRRLRGHLESVDLLHDTFEVALKAFDRFEMRDESSLIHWLGKIAENKIRGAVDRIEAQCRDARRAVPLETGGSEEWRLPEPEDGRMHPMEELLLGEDVERLERCMDELREVHREVIIHRYFEGADWETIAGWMRLASPDAARMRCVRALMELERLCRKRGG